MSYFSSSDDAYLLFSEDIKQKADQEITRLKKEISDNKEKNIKRIEQELHTRIFRNLEIDLNDLNADFSANLSRIRNEYTRVLMKERSVLLDSIVKEARKKSIAFTKTKEYEDYLLNKIENVNSRFPNQRVEFRVMRNDQLAIELIKKHYQGTPELKEISEIEIGGFLAVCFKVGIMLDETIDTRLNEKQLWFYEHSDLAAK